jgi:endonuclease/exonuclease/phosphatase family metal-dependent hydrolase
MKLIQLNIWEGKLLKEVLAFIDEEKPDILCLQEVFSCKGKIPFPDLMFNSLELIQEHTGFEYSFFSPIFTSVYSEVPADLGIAIISRFPIQNQQAIFTNGVYNPNFTDASYFPNTRILQTCSVGVGEKLFNLANHQGHREVDPLGNEISMEKMKIVKTTLEKLPFPLVFAGDLNVKSESPAMRVFDGFLNDLTAEHHVTSTLSQLGKVTNVACDHILVSDNVQVNEFRVAEELVSDHKALIMNFDI